MIAIEVIEEDKDYVIINKPAGILVHPPCVPYAKETIVDWLKSKYPEIINVGDDTVLRPGIVHRLDRVVSGVMVVARTQQGFDFLKREFQERRVKKEYIALVYGVVLKDHGEIHLPLAKAKGRTLVKPEREEIQKGVKQAVTVFDVLERFQHYSLLKVYPLTGRTHQIRAHLAQFGHSVVGDTRYCHPRYRNRKSFTKFVNSDRVFLHASRIGFLNPSMCYNEYEAPLKEELGAFLDTLKVSIG